jgi:hypothetical protein
MLRELFTDLVHAGYKSVIDGVQKIEAVGQSGLSQRKRGLGRAIDDALPHRLQNGFVHALASRDDWTRFAEHLSVIWVTRWAKVPKRGAT